MSSTLRLAARAAIASAVLLCGVTAKAQGYTYTALDLGTLGGSSLTATALNNLGQVVGFSTTASGATHAFMTGANGFGLTDLGTLGGTSSYAADINDAGQVVGRAERADGVVRAFSTGPGGTGMTDLGVLSGGTTSAATGINNSGQIVGYSTTSTTSGAVTRAFSASSAGAALVNLGSFSNPRPPYASNSIPQGLNDSGVVVGYGAEACNCAAAAFKSQVGSSSISHISGLTGNYSMAYAVNASGQVVGVTNGIGSNVYLGGDKAFVTSADGLTVTNLGAALGSTNSVALAINTQGQVGGSFNVGQELHGFITGANALNPVDINTLVAPSADYYFTSVVGVNDAGQVLALASNNRSYLLSVGVVPEPGTWALMGLGLIGVAAARRKRSHG